MSAIFRFIGGGAVFVFTKAYRLGHAVAFGQNMNCRALSMSFESSGRRKGLMFYFLIKVVLHKSKIPTTVVALPD